MSDEDGLFAQLEDVFEGVEEENLHDRTTSSLLEELIDIDDKLREAQKFLWPDTQELRDLHNKRNAIQLVLREKGISV